MGRFFLFFTKTGTKRNIILLHAVACFEWMNLAIFQTYLLSLKGKFHLYKTKW